MQIFFSTSQAWMCPQCVFIPLLTPALPLGKFPLQQHNSPKNWIVSASPEVKDTKKSFRIRHFFSHCQKKKKSSSQIYRETQLKSHIHDSALCSHVPHIFLLVLSMTHRGRSFTGLLTVTFLKSASFRGEGKGDYEQPLHFPQEPCLNMMPREAVGAAEMAFSFALARQTWQTERHCVLK